MTRLHGFFRSSASYRLRIALAIKGIAYEGRYYRLRAGEQRAPAYLALNPQGLVPALEIDGVVLTQSMAICDYLEETRPQPPLLPSDAAMRARVRAAAQVIACETHPLQNLKVLGWLRGLGQDEAGVQAWAARVIEEGFAAFDTLIAPYAGTFSFGDRVTVADLFLIPQMFNARRFGVDLARWPRLLAIEAACLAHPAFIAADPAKQPDAE
ncbi:MAG: maleylacetoacetate isomerase [Sphingomonadales bacterium]|nr:maleylacetoacetate isomerase [Sphingomonadales bacterium]MDE2170557.1 maleylacetoacetate isomerase [Sphingomonadales bacterium]